MPITAIIIDDESLAREGLQLRIGQDPHFDVVALCKDGVDALTHIRTLRPDVIFVDIEMPGLNGIELVNELNKESEISPKVVFITAYQDFALDAFDCDAFDYLLKPYSDERLAACLEKIRLALAEHDALEKQHKLDELLGKKTGKSLDGFIASLEQQQGFGGDDVLTLKNGCEQIRLNIREILWIEAAGDYMYIHTECGNHIVRSTLKQFEEDLHALSFPRVNRSAIINLAKVTKLTPNSNGEYFATLVTGDEIKVSRKYKLKLDQALQSQ